MKHLKGPKKQPRCLNLQDFKSLFWFSNVALARVCASIHKYQGKVRSTSTHSRPVHCGFNPQTGGGFENSTASTVGLPPEETFTAELLGSLCVSTLSNNKITVKTTGETLCRCIPGEITAGLSHHLDVLFKFFF